MLREDKRQKPGRLGTQLLVCIEGTERGEPYGCIHHFRLKRLVPFAGIRELILRAEAIDRLMRGQDPEESICCLEGAERRLLPPEYRETRRPGRLTGEQIQAQLKGIPAREILSMQILGRGGASLQGWIRGGMTDGRMVFFHSVLELMHLMSNAWNRENEIRDREDMRQLQIQE